MNKNSSSWALIVIALGLAGAGISYHFTLEAKFAALEQKLDQNTSALQHYQNAQETTVSAKAAALDKLSKEVDTLQASMEPLGKTTHEQTDSLSDIRKQVASLQQSQQAQADAEKKLADYATQLEKLRQDVQAAKAAQLQAQQQAQVQIQAPAPAPAPPAQTPTVTATISPPSHALILSAPLPVAPKTTGNTVDLRPADITAPEEGSVRAHPVALPLSPAFSDAR